MEIPSDAGFTTLIKDSTGWANLAHSARREWSIHPEVNALLSERETGRALLTAIELTHDFKGTLEAEYSAVIFKNLSWRIETLKNEMAANPYMDFRLRNLWRPKKDKSIYEVQSKEREGKKLLSVRTSGGIIHLNCVGEEVPVPAGATDEKQADYDYCSTARTEFATDGRSVYVREADRITAETPGGEELWRYQVSPETIPEFGMNSRIGLTRLANPTLLNIGGKELIFSGVGHRSIRIGMGVHFEPFGGGVLALDKSGRKIWQSGQGYCKALDSMKTESGENLLIGLFKGWNDAKASYWFLAAMNPLNGEQIWKTCLPEDEEDTHEFFPVAKKPLLILNLRISKSMHPVIVVSMKNVSFISADGRRIAVLKDCTAALSTDFDSDGSDELVVHSRQESYSESGQLIITGAMSNVLWTSPPDRWQPCFAADLDGDGWKELIASRDRSCCAVAVFGKFSGGHFTRGK